MNNLPQDLANIQSQLVIQVVLVKSRNATEALFNLMICFEVAESMNIAIQGLL